MPRSSRGGASAAAAPAAAAPRKDGDADHAAAVPAGGAKDGERAAKERGLTASEAAHCAWDVVAGVCRVSEWCGLVDLAVFLVKMSAGSSPYLLFQPRAAAGLEQR